MTMRFSQMTTWLFGYYQDRQSKINTANPFHKHKQQQQPVYKYPLIIEKPQINNTLIMSVEPQANQSCQWLDTVIRELHENVVKCVVEIEGVIIQKLDKELADSVVAGLNKIVELIDNTKELVCTSNVSYVTIPTANTMIQAVDSPLVAAINPTTTNTIDSSHLTTPKKPQLSSYSKHISFGFTSQIKSPQDFQSLALTNDNLYKQCQQLLQKYRHNKQTLNHENEIVLNQWIENTNHISSNTHLPNKPKKSTFFNLVKSLIQELSKYESVEEYINTVEQIEHDKIVRELRETELETTDTEKKWLKERTKQYLLEMAELIRGEDKETADEEEEGIQNIIRGQADGEEF